MTFALIQAMFQQPQQQPVMTTGGWMFLIVAWFLILCLVGYTFSRVLSNRR